MKRKKTSKRTVLGTGNGNTTGNNSFRQQPIIGANYEQISSEFQQR